MGNRSLTLVCKGGATVQARTATLAGASPVLCEALDKPLAKAGELKLPEDDAETWATALRLIEPGGHTEASMLSWSNIEAALKLADKYDMAAVRCIAAGFLGSHPADVSLDHDLASPQNALRLATLIERYCPQADLDTFLGPARLAIDTTLAASTVSAARLVVCKLKKLVLDPRYTALVSTKVQARVLELLVGDLVLLQCSKCSQLAGLTPYNASCSYNTCRHCKQSYYISLEG